jgi:uncharacterized protein (DUF433 family)
MKQTSFISSNPEILGGQPVIRGTRVPIDRIKVLIMQDFSIGAIKNMYPHISRKKLQAVVNEVFSTSLKKSAHAEISS